MQGLFGYIFGCHPVRNNDEIFRCMIQNQLASMSSSSSSYLRGIGNLYRYNLDDEARLAVEGHIRFIRPSVKRDKGE